MWTRHFKELKELLKEKMPDSNRKSHYIVAVTAIDGAEIALREATRVAAAGERQKILFNAGKLLMLLRLYPEAAVLLKEGTQACF